jgi:spore coat protein U-like protein
MAALIGLGLLFAPTDLRAATCSVSTPGLAFGSYDVYSAAATNGTGTLRVSCTLGAADGNNITVPYTISLSAGSSGGYVQRQMQGGGDTLGYNLYTTTTHSVVWGDGSGSTQTIAGSMKLTNGNPSNTNTHTVFGQIAPLQDVAVANYQANVTVTVTY